MGKAGASLLNGVAPDEVTDELDRFYCYHLSAMLWSEAVRNRLAGSAAFLIAEELREVADESLAAARKLAGRIAELGGAVTADPRMLVDRAPVGAYELPGDPTDVNAILGYALDRVRSVIGSYGEFLERLRGRDSITERLVLDLLTAEVSREDEIESVLPRVVSLR